MSIGRGADKLFLATLLISGSIAGCYPKGWTGVGAELSQMRVHPYAIGPYIVPLATGRMAVVLENNTTGAAPEIDWWVIPAETSTSVKVLLPPDHIHTVEAERRSGLWVTVLDGLPPDVRLAYRVRSFEADVGPFEFRAGRSRGQKFRFAAFGDTRTGHDIHRDLVEAMSREDIDFFINSGDLVEFGGIEDQWRIFFAIESPLIYNRPVLAAIGNHDVSPRRYFEKYFLADILANGRRYYKIDWGDVRVVLLDSEIEMRPGSAQYAFLEDALAEGARDGMLMILSLHYPPYSSGEHGSNMEMRSVLGEIGPRYGVELILAGHDHDYERTKKIDGVTYIVAASAGATIRKISPSSFSEVLRTEPHFVLFDVERGSMAGRTINRAGETFDSFVLEDSPPKK